MATRKTRRGRKRPITKEDLLTLNMVRRGTVAPDGRHFVFAVETARKDRKGYDSHLYRLRLEDGEVRQLTFGRRRDSGPVFSPDGRRVAFLAKRGHYPGIHVIPIDGGEARSVVEKDGSFAALSWSPDGRALLCTFTEADPNPAAKDDEPFDPEKEPPKREAPTYRHITRLFYRLDGAGFLPLHKPQVWTFDVETGTGAALTSMKEGANEPSFSPDGKRIVFTSNVRRDPDQDMGFEDIFVLPSSGGKPRRVPTPVGHTSSPTFSPDGKTIAYLGHDETENPWYENDRVWTVPANGRGPARCLCRRFDQPGYDATISDTGEGFAGLAPRWSPSGAWIYFVSCGFGASGLYKVRARGGTPERVTPEKVHLQTVDLTRDCREAVGVMSDAVTPSEVYWFDLETGESERQTTLTKPWTDEIDIQRPLEVKVRSTEGARVQAWILRPPKFRPTKRYPAIIEVHGGPMTQYGYSFFHELQLLAAQGYVVYYSNPRGSLGYGRAWAEAIKDDWGKRDYEDVMAGADYLESLRYVNPRRIGITGGSYGGFMTNWAVGHTRRFKAAVTQRSVVDIKTFLGSSDVGFAFHHEFGGQPWEVPEAYVRMSPLTYAKNIRTPLLIIHSENDLRCHIEQAENLFATLKLLKRKVELVRFPEESHGLSRGGRPDRRLARLEKILDWFERYL